MDEKEEFATGTHRELKNGKGRFDLLPPRAIVRVAKRLEYGAQKYGDRDWDKGLPYSKTIDSALRHIFQFMRGENNEDHLAAAATQILSLMDTEEKVKEGKVKEEEVNDLK